VASLVPVMYGYDGPFFFLLRCWLPEAGQIADRRTAASPTRRLFLCFSGTFIASLGGLYAGTVRGDD